MILFYNKKGKFKIYKIIFLLNLKFYKLDFKKIKLLWGIILLYIREV